MMKRLLILMLLVMVSAPVQPQSKKAVDARLKAYFLQYESSECNMARCRLVRSELNTSSRLLVVHANAAFAEQPFRPETIQDIYDDIRASLPPPVNGYQVRVFVDGIDIENLVPVTCREEVEEDRRWLKEENYSGAPWVQNVSLPFTTIGG